MMIFPRPYPSLRMRSARRGGAIIPVAAPADLGNLRIIGRRRPAAAWTIDPASHRPVCLWGSQAEEFGRGEDEDAQSRPRSFRRHIARYDALSVPPARSIRVIKVSCR